MRRIGVIRDPDREGVLVEGLEQLPLHEEADVRGSRGLDVVQIEARHEARQLKERSVAEVRLGDHVAPRGAEDEGVQRRAPRLELALPRVDPLGLRAADLSAGPPRDEDHGGALGPELRRREGALVASEVHEEGAAGRREGRLDHGAEAAR